MRSRCTARNQSASKMMGKASYVYTHETGICWGALAVVQELITWNDPNAEGLLFGVCAPAKSSRTQLIAIFIEYAKRNPKGYSEKFSDVVLDALQQTFPCKAQKGKK